MTLRTFGQSTIFWVKPEETKKTKVDIFQDMWCAPCLKKIRSEPCGKQMVEFMACLEIDWKNLPEDSELNFEDVCGEEMNRKDICIEQNSEFYREVFAKFK